MRRSVLLFFCAVSISSILCDNNNNNRRTRRSYLKNFYNSAEEHEANLNRFTPCHRSNVYFVNDEDGNVVRHHHRITGKKLEKLNRCKRLAYNVYNNNNNCRYYSCGRTYCSYCPTYSCRRACRPSCNYVKPSDCSCDPDGSLFPNCDPSSGQCRCKPHFTGPRCDRCEDTFWRTNGNCVPCNCNKDGSTSQKCNQENGQCPCKQGVGRRTCDICKERHYGNVSSGCRECDPCDKPGHICDPKSGQCVCPPRTVGNNCEECAIDAWGYEPNIGCKACECSPTGSLTQRCDLGGNCICKLGYEGVKCNRCNMLEFYGYPNCTKCNCTVAGTSPDQCQNGSCRCSAEGCACKENVNGKRCDTCKPGTFGLDAANPLGCTECFCFGRSTKCIRSSFKWDQLRTNKFYDEQCPSSNRMCYALPTKFFGDLSLTVGGFFRIEHHQNHAQRVYITGNKGVIIEANVKNNVKMIEHNWSVFSDRSNALPAHCIKLTRACFMAVLQNVTNIQIEQVPAIRSVAAMEVILDKAANNPHLKQQSWCEQCECPKEYTSLSCQDPNEGYYRYYPPHADNYIDRMIGIAKKCECNGHSAACDKETGRCLNCSDFTTGDHCELCAEGYYKDHRGNCSPCLCPSETQHFAKSCRLVGKSGFECMCKDGYTGRKCDQCAEKYWGNPQEPNGLCQLCNCNPNGSTTLCNKITGDCECKPGFVGKQCSQCASPRQVIVNGVCTPCDECTQILFNTIDQLSNDLNVTMDLFKDGVGPPWPVLNQTLHHVNFLTNKFDTNMQKASDLIRNVNVKAMEEQVQRIKKDLNANNKELEVLTLQEKRVEGEANAAKASVGTLAEKIESIIKNLNDFGNSQVNADQAQLEAQQILNEIKSRSIQRHDQLFKTCDKLSKDIENIYADKTTNPGEIKSKLNDLKHRLSNLNVILSQTENVNKLAKTKNKQNALRIEQLTKNLSTISNETQLVKNNVLDTIEKINQTHLILDDIRKIYTNLSKLNDEIYDNIDQLDSEDHNDNNSYELIAAVAEHVKNLQNKVKHYNSLVNFTKDEWVKINASGAYDNLVKGVQEARQTAKEALNTMYDTLNLLNPKGNDSLIDATNIAKAFSDRLEKRVNSWENLTLEIQQVYERLEQLQYDIKNNGRDNNDLIAKLHNIKEPIDYYKLDRVSKEARNISDNMAAIKKSVTEIKNNDLFKVYDRFYNITSKNEMDKFYKKINSTCKELEDLRNNTSVSISVLDKIKTHNRNNSDNVESLSSKIQALKNNIQQASQLVKSITVGMSLNNCTRRYKFENDISILESIKIVFKCNSTCNLFQLEGENQLKIVASKTNLKIVWQRLESNFDFNVHAKDSDTLILNKIGQVVTIELNGDNVHVINLPDSQPFKLSNQKLLVSNNNSLDELNCLKTIEINGKQLGLWNFVSSEGSCKGCDIESKRNYNQFFYLGDGYKFVTNVSRPDGRQFDLKFTFTTFDINSMIFIAKDLTSNCSYLYVGIKDGYVILHVLHTDGTEVILQTANKYNRGESSEIEIVMLYDNTNLRQHYNLKVNDKTVKDERNLAKKNIFKIKFAEKYIGGISPIFLPFNKTCIGEDTTSFLGFLQSSDEYNNHVNIRSYGIKGVADNVTELRLNKVWFNGHGAYVEFDSNVKMIENKKLEFVLKSNETNGFIADIHDLKLAIKNRKLLVKYRDGPENLTEKDFSGFDMISVEFQPKNVAISLNNETLSVPFSLEKGKNIKLFMGHDQSNKHPDLTGGISQIIINNELIYFSKHTVKSFNRAEIGREKSIPDLNQIVTKQGDHNLMREMQNTEGCPLIGPYETDSEAVKFGDKANSYIYVLNNFWKKDYVLEFKFRVFYPNGLLFIAIGNNQQKHFNIFDIRDGRLRLRIKGKRMKQMDLPQKINDGEWHTVQLTQTGQKRKRKLMLILDGLINRSMKMPRNNVKGEIYFGGTPRGFPTDFAEIKNQLYQFRGCMSSLKINKSPQIWIKNKKNVIYNNIGQCFRHVEKGAYFGGAAFAIYKSDFKVNKILELSFEFRTVEQNGILLSVSNLGNSPALSVELQNGAVVMTIDMGNGAISNVTNSLDSDFTLCNNRWHNITALYSSSELTVNVDGIRKSWVQSDVNSLMDEIEAPLYIGGLPDNAPSGTLKIKENFKGCIRNLKIEENIMDWTDMKELNNVLLNACPVQTQ